VEESEAEYDKIIDAEFAWVKECFWIEPEDQSAWLYHRWLLGRVVASGPELPALGISLGIPLQIAQLSHSESPEDAKKTFQRRRQRQIEVFESELAMCSELEEQGEASKWVLLTIAVLSAALEACRPSSEEAHRKTVQSIQSIFTRLVSLDGMRKQYYLDVQQSLLKQINPSSRGPSGASAAGPSGAGAAAGSGSSAEGGKKEKPVVVSQLAPLLLQPMEARAWWWPQSI